jgi:hypothetical protein
MPRVQQKRGTASALASVNPTPAAGEIIWESDTNKLKIGDGTTAYNSLPYVSGEGGGSSTAGLTGYGAKLLFG